MARYDQPMQYPDTQIDEQAINANGFIANRWGKLDGVRGSILTRCEQYAEWTLPSVFPRAGTNESTELQLDYQSVGAEAVNTMANKLGLTLLTPHRPFFRLNLTTEETRQVMKKHPQMDLPIIQAALAEVEKEAMNELERWGLRVSTVDAAKLLLITGNALIKVPEKDGDKAKTFSMRRYCMNRDQSGNVIEIIVREVSSLGTFSDEKQKQIMAARHENKERDEVIMYTYIKLIDGKWIVYQAADEFTLPDTRGQYPKDECPWIVLVWNRVDNETYGRGLVEDYSGDFHALAGVYEAGVNVLAVLCDLKFISDPRANNDIDTLNNSPTGTYVSGTPDSIKATIQGVVAPLEGLQFFLQDYKQRIGAAFLVTSSQVRNAERVTAEEIRLMAEELDARHGSVYSNLSQDYQARIAKLLLDKVKFDLAESEPTIITGLDSLARSADVQNLRLMLQDMAMVQNLPESYQAILKLENLTAMFGTGYGVKYNDLIKTKEELAADAEAQGDAAFNEAAAAGAGQAVGQAQVQSQLPQGQ